MSDASPGVVRRLLAESEVAHRDQRRALEAAWSATGLALLGASAVPWFLGALDLRFSRIAWALFGYALVAWCTSTLIERVPNARRARAVFAIGQVANVTFLALFWHLLGGVRNPAGLVAFFIPVCAAGIVLRRRAAVQSALASIGVVAVVAFFESPELQWYLAQIGLPVQGIIALMPAQLPFQAEPFPGVQLAPAFHLTLLSAFSVVLLTAAIVTSSLGARTRQLVMRLGNAAGEAPRPPDLYRASLCEDPTPRVLIYSDSAQIAEASRGFMQQMLLTPKDIAGKTLYEVMAFDSPNDIQRLVALPDGDAPFVAYRIGPEARLASVRTFGTRVDGTDYTLVSVEDRSELFYLARALDALDEALLVIRGGREVGYFNDAAGRLFAGLHAGMDPSTLQEGDSGLASWWSATHKSSVSDTIILHGRPYAVRRDYLRPAGSPEVLVLLRLRLVDADAAERAPVQRSA